MANFSPDVGLWKPLVLFGLWMPLASSLICSISIKIMRFEKGMVTDFASLFKYAIQNIY